MTGQIVHLATSEIVFTRILVATDFSKPANQALKLAISLCQFFGSKLSLVYASVPIPCRAEAGPVPVEALNSDLEASKEQMQEIVRQEPGLSALDPHVVVAYAEAIHLINRVSKEDEADLIVVGSHSARGLERFILGSVAEAVMHQAMCPVLIVGPNCKTELHPFRSILFATDLKTTGLRGAQYATSLAERFHSRLTVLHVMSPNFKDHNEHEVVKSRVREELAQLLPSDIEQYCKTKILLEYGRPDDAITSVAKTECASMIVVGLQDKAFADHAGWSKLSHIIREANCPVLAVRGHLI
jgi:nucleotide-binding universal stress UspA family protein